MTPWTDRWTEWSDDEQRAVKRAAVRAAVRRKGVGRARIPPDRDSGGFALRWAMIGAVLALTLIVVIGGRP